MADNIPTSAFGEDDAFEKAHVAKSKTSVGDLKKMETEGTADIKTKDTKKRKIKEPLTPREYVGQHKGQFASLLFVMALLCVGITATVLLSPTLLLVNIKENLVNDLNDGTKAYYAYSNKVLDMTSQGGGCDYQSNPSIKCKFQTMSTYMRKNFTKHGFTIMPPEPPDPYESAFLQMSPPPPETKKDNPPPRQGTRVLQDTYGHSISDSLSSMAEKDPTFRRLLYKVFSPRTSLFQDRKFDERLYNKFHITRDTAVGGTTDEEVRKSFDSQVDGDGTDYIDLNGQGNFGAAKLANSSDQWRKIMTNLIGTKKGMKVSSFASTACAYDAYEKMAENAVVNARRVSVARYAMNYLEAADAIKAGYAQSPVTHMVLSGALIQDSNNATDAASYRTPAMFESAGNAIEVADPSKLLMMLTVPGSMMGTLKDHLLETFAHGIGLSSPASPPKDGIYQPKSQDPYGWCTAAQSNPEKFNNEVKFVPGIPPSWYCNVHARSLATILGYGLLGVEMGLEPVYYIEPTRAVACMTLENIPVTLVATTLSPLVQAFADATFSPVRSMTKSNDIPYLQDNPSSTDIQDTIFAGTGIILGDMAQSRGLKPVTLTDIPAFTQYLKESARVKQQYVEDQMAQAHSEPFNIYNRYSLFGMVLQDMLGGKRAATSTIDGMVSFFGMMGRSVHSVVAAINPVSNAMFSEPLAPQFDVSRLTKCGFNYNQRFWGKEGINIMADFGCNIRYFMPQNVLDMDINNVIDYMTKEEQPRDVDWAQKTVDELNQRSASGRDAARLAKEKSNAQQGASGAFVDKKTGKPNLHTQYAKFLQYCVERQDPWGASALAIDWKPKEYDHDPLYYYGKDIYSAYQDPNNPGQTEETPDSYYAAGSGSKVDQDWYTGKNCLKDNKMIDNFRAYTLACSVLAAMSGSRECWDVDEEPHDMPDDFYLTNDILFLSNHSASFGGPAEGSGAATSP